MCFLEVNEPDASLVFWEQQLVVASVTATATALYVLVRTWWPSSESPDGLDVHVLPWWNHGDSGGEVLSVVVVLHAVVGLLVARLISFYGIVFWLALAALSMALCAVMENLFLTGHWQAYLPIAAVAVMASCHQYTAASALTNAAGGTSSIDPRGEYERVPCDPDGVDDDLGERQTRVLDPSVMNDNIDRRSGGVGGDGGKGALLHSCVFLGLALVVYPFLTFSPLFSNPFVSNVEVDYRSYLAEVTNNNSSTSRLWGGNGHNVSMYTTGPFSANLLAVLIHVYVHYFLLPVYML